MIDLNRIKNIKPDNYLVHSKDYTSIKEIYKINYAGEDIFCYKTKNDDINILKNCFIIKLTDNKFKKLKKLELTIKNIKTKLHEIGLELKENKRNFELTCLEIISNGEEIKIGDRFVFKNKYFDDAKMHIDVDGSVIIDFYKGKNIISTCKNNMFNVVKSFSSLLGFAITFNPPMNNHDNECILLSRYNNRFSISNKNFKDITKQELDDIFLKIEKIFEKTTPDFVNKFNNDNY